MWNTTNILFGQILFLQGEICCEVQLILHLSDPASVQCFLFGGKTLSYERGSALFEQPDFLFRWPKAF